MALTIRLTNIDAKLDELRKRFETALTQAPKPPFETFTEDIPTLREKLGPFQKYKNILLVANGGSVWSFMSYYTALADRMNGKTIVLLTDMEPDYLAIIKQKYQPSESLVLVISKSGSTVGVIEDLLALREYPQLYVTDLDSPLGQIGKQLDIPVIVHPPVGGRFSGLTSCAYTPAILCDLPAEEIEQGARAGYDLYRQIDGQNDALNVALALYSLEQNGFNEVFLPIYSNFLTNFGIQVTQLFHESFGKAGKGLTVLAVQAPESQHHTNQRFFGGPKNMVGVFLRAENQRQDIAIVVPEELSSIPLRTSHLSDLNDLSLAKSFTNEFIGTFTEAKNQGIPLIEIVISEVSGESVGQLMAFWHYVTVFSALLREVDPYDQPQVEASKVISFEERLKY